MRRFLFLLGMLLVALTSDGGLLVVMDGLDEDDNSDLETDLDATI